MPEGKNGKKKWKKEKKYIKNTNLRKISAEMKFRVIQL